MLVVGLTGSIGMGKSTVAAYLQTKGVPVIDADKIVHDLYKGEAVPKIEAAFPGTTENGEVQRDDLLQALMSDPTRFEVLEEIVHPLVRKKEQEFLKTQAEHGADIAVLEIPLLLETGAEKLFDAVIVVSAGEEVQRQRVLARDGMTEQKFEEILNRQMSDYEKRSCADFIVDTGAPLVETQAQIDVVLDELIGQEQRQCHAYQRWLEDELS